MIRAGVGAFCVGSRFEWCFFETVFFLAVVVERVEGEAELLAELDWAKTGRLAVNRAAKSVRNFTVRLIDV